MPLVLEASREAIKAKKQQGRTIMRQKRKASKTTATIE
jgi:hypothetical protein